MPPNILSMATDHQQWRTVAGVLSRARDVLSGAYPWHNVIDDETCAGGRSEPRSTLHALRQQFEDSYGDQRPSPPSSDPPNRCGIAPCPPRQ